MLIGIALSGECSNVADWTVRPVVDVGLRSAQKPVTLMWALALNSVEARAMVVTKSSLVR